MPDDDFEQIVSQHYEPLYRFAFSLTRSEADACDLTQQTFYIWATKGHQLQDRSKVKSWLFTTLHREFLNRMEQSRANGLDIRMIALGEPTAADWSTLHGQMADMLACP